MSADLPLPTRNTLSLTLFLTNTFPEPFQAGLAITKGGKVGNYRVGGTSWTNELAELL